MNCLLFVLAKVQVFQAAMESAFGISAEDKLDADYDVRMTCVKHVLGAVADETVNLEMFGRVLNWMGPWSVS